MLGASLAALAQPASAQTEPAANQSSISAIDRPSCADFVEKGRGCGGV